MCPGQSVGIKMRGTVPHVHAHNRENHEIHEIHCHQRGCTGRRWRWRRRAGIQRIGHCARGPASGSTGLNRHAATTGPAATRVDNGPADPRPVDRILNNLSNPGVTYRTKDGLVEGGIGSGEGHQMDHDLRVAYRNGQLPLSFNVSNIQENGPTTVMSDVAISGPKLSAPVTKNLMFVNQNGNWVLSSPSATSGAGRLRELTPASARAVERGLNKSGFWMGRAGSNLRPTD